MFAAVVYFCARVVFVFVFAGFVWLYAFVFEITRGTLWAAKGHYENKCETFVFQITRA